MGDDQPAQRGIPAVHRVVDWLLAHDQVKDVARPLVVDAARFVIDRYRDRLADADGPMLKEPLVALSDLVLQRLSETRPVVLEGAINATGIILHTGLGRAPLAAAAVAAMSEVAGGYAPVELNLATGERGRRSDLIRDLIHRITGAESATVVNNNAAALMVVLSTLARDRSVIVSRGELIEIGGSYRLPDVITAGGATLREVGTTNRTRIEDYQRAINEDTAALIKVHPSNYRIEGFTEAVSVAELSQLGRRHGLPVIDDIGSGALRPTAMYGWPSDEPSASASIDAGADIVLFSGDKLLGGPQAGLIIGRRRLIDSIERHPMMRALRVDKVTLAALGATLKLHLDPKVAARELPVYMMLNTPVEQLQQRGERLRSRIDALQGVGDVEQLESSAFLGGGSLPTQAVPSVALRITAASLSEQEFAHRLRTGHPAVVARVSEGALWLDLRTIQPDQDDELVDAVEAATNG